MAANDTFADLLDFVEEHGGSLGGEQRAHLHLLAAAYAHDWTIDVLIREGDPNG
jgi:hypothetical protein